MIVVYGGVQADPPGRTPPRLPPEALGDVSDRLTRLLAHLGPTRVVGAAASGADLLIIEAALHVGVPVRVVLPYDSATFRHESVEPAAPDWGGRFERLMGAVGVEVVEGGSAVGGLDVYLAHNRHLLDDAATVAGPAETVWCLVVRPQETAATSVSDDLAHRAGDRGLTVIDLDPTVGVAQRRSAFVAMPYGRKFDPTTRRVVDCDAVFNRIYVPVLEDLDLEWVRADLEADSGIVHVGMIDSLGNADLVIADLFGGNANVAYELGIRHALAPRATVMTRPQLEGFKVPQLVPFDVMPSRHVPIRRSVEAVTDEEAGEAVAELRRVLVGVLNGQDTDSPVFTLFDRADGLLVRRDRVTGGLTTESVIRTHVQAAGASGSEARLLEAAQEVDGADLPETTRRRLRLQLAVDLAAIHAHPQATPLFEVSEPPPHDPLRLRWLQEYAVSLSWQGRDAAAEGLDPSASWDRADRLLEEAITMFGDSEESCAVAAGIAKRRFRSALDAGDETLASAWLDRMVELYRRGLRAEPGYYAGVNIVASLRLGLHHFGRADMEGELRATLPVAEFFATREVEIEPQSFWALVSLAELRLHRSLLDGEADAGPVASAYRRAVLVPAPAAWRRSAADQLRLFRRCGDPDPFIAPSLAALAADGTSA